MRSENHHRRIPILGLLDRPCLHRSASATPSTVEGDGDGPPY